MDSALIHGGSWSWLRPIMGLSPGWGLVKVTVLRSEGVATTVVAGSIGNSVIVLATRVGRAAVACWTVGAGAGALDTCRAVTQIATGAIRTAKTTPVWIRAVTSGGCAGGG